MLQLRTIFDHFGGPFGFLCSRRAACSGKLARQRDPRVFRDVGTLLHRKLQAMIGQADDSGTKMMATGTVKSFNPAKGYGFIKTDTGGVEVFVHLSAIREAGLADLRKGQKISFEIFDNQGKAAAKESEH